MVKVDVISGFLGAGKTTLIKKLFESDLAKEKVVLIENEFGEIGIDGTFLKNSGVEIKEINSGCICCSLVGDFASSMKEVIEKFSPERIIIEPSGVGKLSDIVRAIEGVDAPLELNILATVVDGGKCKMYLKNFGEFYIDQVKQANTVVVSRSDKLTDEKIEDTVNRIKELNPHCTIITTPITSLDGDKLLQTLEQGENVMRDFIEQLKAEHHEEEECHCHHHHDEDEEHEHHCHHHDDEDEHEHHCCHGHHHDDDDDDDEHEHHHHDDDDEHEHHCCHGHHHDEDEEHEHHCHHDDEEEHDHHCCHGHHHHHGHDADEVFSSIGIETIYSYSHDELDGILSKLSSEDLGIVLRAKGYVKALDCGNWYYFDFVAGDYEIREGAPEVGGKICVIGSKLHEEDIKRLFK